MPFQKGHKLSVGNKSGGRKTAYEEFNKVKSVNLLWEKVRKKIEKGQELSEFEQKLCNSVLPKTIKQNVDVMSGNQPISIYAGKSIQGHSSNSESVQSKQKD